MDLTEDRIEAFIRARGERPRWVPVAPEYRPQSETEGYRLQHLIHEALVRHGVHRVGYKIGCTSKTIQASYGIDEPIYAGIFDTSRFDGLRAALAKPMLSPLLECEIAFVTGAALDGASDLSDAALTNAVASTHLACEIIDARYGAPPPQIGVPTLLTDDYLHVGFVLGPAVAGWRDLPLDRLPGAIEIDGAMFAGNSGQVLSPFQSLRWLVGKLAGNGQRLEAGEIVLTGSLVPPTPVRLPAQTVTISAEGFGALGLKD